MSLTPTFELTPRESYSWSASDQWAYCSVLGMTLLPRYNAAYRSSLDQQHANDEAFFYPYAAADPSLDYAVWNNRRLVPHVELRFNLSAFGTQKELALVFGFDALTESRVLIYSNAEQLGDETLAVGDNQFLMEVESLDTQLSLYFIHANRIGSSNGGWWFFQGITGYVI